MVATRTHNPKTVSSPQATNLSDSLKGFTFVLSGDLHQDISSVEKRKHISSDLKITNTDVENFIKSNGGKVVKRLTKTTTHLLATREEIENKSGKVKQTLSGKFPQVETIDIESLFVIIEKAGLQEDLKNKNSSTKTEKRKSDASLQTDAEEETKRKVQRSLNLIVPLDPLIPPIYKNFKVLVDETRIWHVLLNCADIRHNNNKFYIIQLCVDSEKSKYIVFNRWGRVGENGQTSYSTFDLEDLAKGAFMRKYKEKSRKYTELEPHFEENKQIANTEAPEFPASKLHPSVQELISLIFDFSLLSSQMKSLDYDINKLPLGKLKDSTISQGYSVLRELSKAIEENTEIRELQNLSSQFYTLIPHAFGRRIPPTIDSPELIDAKIKMLESLNDAVITNNLQEEAKKNVDKHPIDAQFETLNIDHLAPVAPDSDDFKLIEAYVQTSRGISHSGQLELLECFDLRKNSEFERYQNNGHHDNHNRMLLWHGSRLMNFVGILSQGLRIAPPEAPVNGYMFGKGVYFADIVTKSANYCDSYASNNIGLMLLCEVAVGDSFELTNSDYQAGEKVKKMNKHSTKGLGQYFPDPNQFATLSDGTLVPIGTQLTDKSRYLMYNEYIVYDVSQIKIRYLLKFKMTWSQ